MSKNNLFLFLTIELFFSSIMCQAVELIKHDGPQTIALWHMQETSSISGRDYILDEDIYQSGRDGNLKLGNKTDPVLNSAPQVVSGGYFGNALNFDGVDDIAFFVGGWKGFSAFEIDFWVKIDSMPAAEQTVFYGSGCEIRILTTGEIKVWAFLAAGGYVSQRCALITGQWNHVIVTVNGGTLILKVNDNSIIPIPCGGIVNTNSDICLGNKLGQTRWFDGQLDEILITGLDLPIYQLDDYETNAIWHMDGDTTIGSREYVLDDDSLRMEDNNLKLGSWNDPPGTSVPQIVSGVDGSALDFDGVNDIAFAVNGWPACSRVNVDFWVKADSNSIEQDIFYTPAWTIRVKPDKTIKCWVIIEGGGYQTLVSQTIALGQWYHVIFAVNDNNAVLMVDDIASTITLTANMIASAGTLSIGNKDGYSRWFNGQLDEVKISSKSINTPFPRLFFSNQDIDVLRNTIDDPNYFQYWELILEKATNFCSPISPDYIDPDSDWFTENDDGYYGRDVQGWIEPIGFAYQITGDPFFGRHGAAILDSVCDYVTPEGRILSMNIDLMRTFAVGYDWVRSAMTSAQKNKIEQRSREYLEWALYGNEINSETSWYPYHNFMGVGFGGTGLLAMALYKAYPTEVNDWIDDSVFHVSDWHNQGFDSNGAYFEGHGYCNYGFSNSIAFADALQRNYNDDILFDVSNIQKLSHYYGQIRLPGENIYEARNDSMYDSAETASVAMIRMALEYDDHLLEWFYEQQKQHASTWPPSDYHIGGSCSPFRIIWGYDMNPVSIENSSEPLTEHFEDRGLVTFRTGWDVNDLYFSIEAGPYYHVTHNQADKGHFGLYAYGTRWAVDPGYGNNRDVNGRCQTVAHNCILVDGVGQAVSGASWGTNGQITNYSNQADYGYVLADSTDAYNINNHNQPGAIVDHAYRHAVFVKDADSLPAYVVIMDDIQKDSSLHQYAWQLLTWPDNEIEVEGTQPVIGPMEYVWTPLDTTGTGTCIWTFNITTAGNYYVWGYVQAKGDSVSSSNSFYVEIDSGGLFTWGFQEGWDMVDASPYNLSVGQHTIQFQTRERGACIGKVVLTRDSSALPPFLPPISQGIMLNPADADVTSPMVFVPRPADMKIYMDAAALPVFSVDMYEPNDGRVPEAYPRLQASVTAIAPKFFTILIPKFSDIDDPTITFSNITGGRKAAIQWSTRRDIIEWSSAGVVVDIDDTPIFVDGFETDFNKWTTDWERITNQKKSGSYSAHAGSASNDLISNDINTSGYASMIISFWYIDDDIDDDDDIYLQFYNGASYINKFELGNSLEGTWHQCIMTVYNSGSDAQYFCSNFRIKFEGTSIDSGENLWIDDVSITLR